MCYSRLPTDFTFVWYLMSLSKCRQTKPSDRVLGPNCLLGGRTSERFQTAQQVCRAVILTSSVPALDIPGLQMPLASLPAVVPPDLYHRVMDLICLTGSSSPQHFPFVHPIPSLQIPQQVQTLPLWAKQFSSFQNFPHP